jgi:hypothetical protein
MHKKQNPGVLGGIKIKIRVLAALFCSKISLGKAKSSTKPKPTQTKVEKHTIQRYISLKHIRM